MTDEGQKKSLIDAGCALPKKFTKLIKPKGSEIWRLRMYTMKRLILIIKISSSS